MLVAGRAFFIGPGCFVCPWAAARPRAVRAASCARRVVSKPGQAPPPPTGTAARPSGPSATHGHRSQAHPTSEPSHAKPLLGPRRSPPALTPLIPEPTRNFACNSPETISNLQFRSLELQRFQTLLKLLPIELRATFRGQTRNTRQPPRLKPMTPMRVDHCHEMKPPTPLRAPWRTRLKPLTPLLAQNSRIQAVFRPQRCHGFHAPLAEYPQRRRRFHPRRTLRPQPKPRVACAHATRPVAHWPHD